MQLTVVGSSDAFNAAGRFHSCYLLESQNTGTIMIDFGATSLAALRQIDRTPSEIDAIAFTHLHGDHLAGLPFYILDAMFVSFRTQSLEIVGPPLTEDRIEALMKATYKEVMDRPRSFAIDICETEPGQTIECQGFKISCYSAVHMSAPDIAMSLRIEDPQGKVAVFSGDTAMNPQLLAAAEQADVLVAECSALHPPIGKHCTFDDWIEAMPKLSAKRLILSHLDEIMRQKAPELLNQAPDNLRLDFADDGMKIVI